MKWQSVHWLFVNARRELKSRRFITVSRYMKIDGWGQRKIFTSTQGTEIETNIFISSARVNTKWWACHEHCPDKSVESISDESPSPSKHSVEVCHGTSSRRHWMTDSSWTLVISPLIISPLKSFDGSETIFPNSLHTLKWIRVSSFVHSAWSDRVSTGCSWMPDASWSLEVSSL